MWAQTSPLGPQTSHSTYIWLAAASNLGLASRIMEITPSKQHRISCGLFSTGRPLSPQGFRKQGSALGPEKSSNRNDITPAIDSEKLFVPGLGFRV